MFPARCAYLGICSNDQLPCLVHHQNSKSECERNTPEFSRNRGSSKDSLQARPVQVCNPNESSANHANWNGEVAPRSPERIGVENGNASWLVFWCEHYEACEP